MGLTVIGWINGIFLLVLLIAMVSFTSWVLWMSSKQRSKILLYFGLNYAFITLWFLGPLVDIITIFYSGINMDPDLFLILTLLSVPPVMVTNTEFYRELRGFRGDKIILLGIALAGIFFWFFLFIDPQLSIDIHYPPTTGGDILNFTYIPFSPIGLIIIIYSIIYTPLILGLLLKALKLRGKLRLKYLYIFLGSIIFFIGLYLFLYTLMPLFIWIIIASLTLLIMSLGVIPAKSSKPKRKAVSREELKFASYLTGSSKKTDLSDKQLVSQKTLNEEVLIFMSYATKDADLFKVKDIAEKLTKYTEIEDVLYWQEDMEDNIFEYMNDNLGRCHAMILFCSKASLDSVPVKKEWTAAEAAGLPIIPVFYDVNHIPTLLKSRLGVEYDFYDLDRNVLELHSLILKKCGGIYE